MRNLFLALFLLFSLNSYAGDCGTSAISRSNSVANTVLTSSAYNTDHNTAYTAINAINGSYDGGCITDGTLEDGALNTTDFGAVLNGIKDGCHVTKQSAGIVSVGNCRLSINGNFVHTSTGTTVSYGCVGCQSEAASQWSYVYAKAGSSGSTLTLQLGATSPNNDGYDSDGNRVLGRVFNDGSQDFSSDVLQWNGHKFEGESYDQVCYAYYFTTSGTNAGTSVVTFTNRTFNAKDGQCDWLSIGNDRFKLTEAGTYHIQCSAPIYRGRGHQTRLRNLTDASTEIAGTTEYADDETNSADPLASVTRSTLGGFVTITAAKGFALQHIVQRAEGGSGLGQAISSGENQIWNICRVERVN